MALAVRKIVKVFDCLMFLCRFKGGCPTDSPRYWSPTSSIVVLNWVTSTSWRSLECARSITSDSGKTAVRVQLNEHSRTPIRNRVIRFSPAACAKTRFFISASPTPSPVRSRVDPPTLEDDLYDDFDRYTSHCKPNVSAWGARVLLRVGSTLSFGLRFW